MNQIQVDFATFCHAGDVNRLYAPGQLEKQIESNNFHFDNIILVHQNCEPKRTYGNRTKATIIYNIDTTLKYLGIDIDKPQYESNIDRQHKWKYHVVNHLTAVSLSKSDYIVFADNDCWMVKQPSGLSWINKAIVLLSIDPEIFIVSPNDGERKRKTQRFSQQMFIARTEEFRNADFNQPGWDGNVNISNGPMPEYWGMLEGRMELYCRQTNQYRYVLGPEYRYFHHNRLTEDGHFDTDYERLGWV